MIKKETVYKIGKIGKPHGVDGEVSFHFDDDIFDRVDADYLILDIDGILVPFFLDEYRFKNDETALVRYTPSTTLQSIRSSACSLPTAPTCSSLLPTTSSSRWMLSTKR